MSRMDCIEVRFTGMQLSNVKFQDAEDCKWKLVRRTMQLCDEKMRMVAIIISGNNNNLTAIQFNAK